MTENNRNVLPFAAGGELPASIGNPAIRVDVKSIGRLVYPINEIQANELIKLAQPAPFGKGAETILDKNVREAWQIDPSRFRIDDRWMKESLPELVNRIKEEFGIASDCQVEAHLYKMLFYEKGGHFLRHKDTEKEEGMFGSLLIQLPAEHEGGELVVEHLKWKKQFAFDKESGDKSFYSAFYADCDHILHPVTDGYRLVLVFNLVCVGGMNLLPKLQDIDENLLGKVRKAVKLWDDDEDAPRKFEIPLEHKYSTANLNFQRLKGNDYGKVELIRSCYDEKGKSLFKVLLMMMVKHKEVRLGHDDKAIVDYRPESWIDENGTSHTLSDASHITLDIDYPRSFLVGMDYDKDVDVEDDVDNLDDRYGRDSEFSRHVFKIHELEDYYEPHTGNEGCRDLYWYRSAFIVFWPSMFDK
jgi:hypothetical protein